MMRHGVAAMITILSMGCGGIDEGPNTGEFGKGDWQGEHSDRPYGAQMTESAPGVFSGTLAYHGSPGWTNYTFFARDFAVVFDMSNSRHWGELLVAGFGEPPYSVNPDGLQSTSGCVAMIVRSPDPTQELEAFVQVRSDPVLVLGDDTYFNGKLGVITNYTSETEGDLERLKAEICGPGL